MRDIIKKENVVLKLVNKKNVKAEELSVPYRNGINIVFRIPLTNAEAVVVTKEMFTDVPVTDLLETAKRNTQANNPIRIVGLGKMLALMMGVEANGCDDTYVVTNDSMVNGATTILYPDFHETVRRETGFENYIIIPSSVHELLIRPFEDVETMEGILREVNSQPDCITEDTFLSDDLLICFGGVVTSARDL